MALEEYKRKRDFKRTPEPGPKVARKSKTPIFVIQEHHATRLHYDLRLEADGVLKSWAVTKEPTLDPSIKRLAVEVEDHPMSYARFSGDIPEGEYGAGHVEIWDRGTYRNLMLDKPEPMSVAEGIEAGHLEFELKGEKLKGTFAMIRMKDRGPRHNWLLIKMKDEMARPSADGDASDDASSDGTTRGSGRTSSKTGARKPGTRKPDARKPGARKPGAKKESSGSARASRKATGETAEPASVRPKKKGEPEEPRLTNLEKVMFPETGYTKEDLLHYYEEIADHLLPHLVDRPVTVERFPDGIGDGTPRFWQKNTPPYYPSWIPRVELPSDDEKDTVYALVNDVETLLYFVNQGTITFHVWQSRIHALDHPDYVIFDLDPGKRTFADVVTVAKTLHAILEEEEIDSYVKTSGKSGLHVIVPWTAAGDYDDAREWLVGVGKRVVAELPEIATMERSKSKRGGRLYLDVMQNARGRHVVPPYVVRATPGATVSAPLQWREVNSRLSPSSHDIGTMLRRIGRQKEDPLEELVRTFTTKPRPRSKKK